jgi:hypothetical protein
MAWRFNGQSGYAGMITTASNAATIASSGSIGGWVYRVDGAGTGADYVWGQQAATARWYLAWPKNDAAWKPGTFLFYMKDANGSSTELYSSVAASTGAWHHVMVTWTATVLKFYIDGAVMADTASTSGLVFPFTVSAVTYIGRHTTTALYFPGFMAEWAKWDRALSAAEIAVLAKGATPDWFANGLAWYLPMRKEPVELVRRIPVKLIVATPVDHPLHFRPASMGWAARAMGVAP